MSHRRKDLYGADGRVSNGQLGEQAMPAQNRCSDDGCRRPLFIFFLLLPLRLRSVLRFPVIAPSPADPVCAPHRRILATSLASIRFEAASTTNIKSMGLSGCIWSCWNATFSINPNVTPETPRLPLCLICKFAGFRD